MGWLWSSSSSESNATQSSPSATAPIAPEPQARSVALTDEQTARIFGRPNTTPQPSKQASREEQADVELQAFLSSLEVIPSDQPERSVKQTRPTQIETQDASSEPPRHDRIREDGTLNISPEALLPRTMSCRQAFDAAFYCQSLGGKFNDIYRYGHLRSCSDHWSAFWFCMRTRTLAEKERERQISEHYSKVLEKKRKEFGSSEDVWQIRDKPVERAFWRDPDEAEDIGGAGKV